MRTESLRFSTALKIAVVTLGLVCSASGASAQFREPVPADFKGAVGLGLFGAELGAVIPALAGMDATWAYIVFPAVGAAGGAVAGYFAIDNPGHAQLSVVALTAGMALIIPALVVTLSLTAYDPEGERDDAKRRKVRRLAAAGPGLLRVSHGELALAAPGIGPTPSGLSMSLLSGRF